MTTPTYTTDYTAIRGFRRQFPHLASMSDDLIRADIIDRAGDLYVLNLEMIAYAEADRKGELKTDTYRDIPQLRRSMKPKGATARVRAFFASLPQGTARKEAIAAAVANGFAYCTARTQYQVWKAA